MATVKIESRRKNCCNCGHNIRIPRGKGVACICELDDSYISFNQCFSRWCPKWTKEEKK